jgi:hypothetical protein
MTMSDLDRFERRLEARLLAHLDGVVRPFDPLLVTREAASIDRTAGIRSAMIDRLPGLSVGRGRSRHLPASTILVWLMLVLLVGAAIVLAGSHATLPAPVPYLRSRAVGPMGIARCGASGVGLTDGGALIVGGWDATGAPVTIAERFDATTRTFHLVEGVTTAGDGIGTTLLADGRVLITGGRTRKSSAVANDCSSTVRTGALGTETADVFLFDPATDRIQPAAPMPVRRAGHATLTLEGGAVLIAGGNGLNDDGDHDGLRTALLVDPGTGVSVATGPMYLARGWSSSDLGHREPHLTRVPGGRVLVTGGTLEGEVFDPGSGTFGEPTADSSAASAPVLVVASSRYQPAFVQSYDPRTASLVDAWVPSDLAGSGARFVIDGPRLFRISTQQVELRTFAADGSSRHEAIPWNGGGSRSWEVATLLTDGSVLVAGGSMAAGDGSVAAGGDGVPTTEAETLTPGDLDGTQASDSASSVGPWRLDPSETVP